MRLEMHNQQVIVEEIPNEAKLTNVVVNIQEGLVELVYEGFIPASHTTNYSTPPGA